VTTVKPSGELYTLFVELIWREENNKKPATVAISVCYGGNERAIVHAVQPLRIKYWWGGVVDLGSETWPPFFSSVANPLR